MLNYLFIFITGMIIIAILKSMFRKISYINEFDINLESTHDIGRIVNFDTNESETQIGPQTN